MAEDPTVFDQTEENEEEEDEFDRLRRKSTMASSVYDDLPSEGESSTNPLSRLTGPQVTLLAILAIIDVIVVVIALLIVLGQI